MLLVDIFSMHTHIQTQISITIDKLTNPTAMNSTNVTADSVFNGSKAGGTDYAIGVSVGILLLIVTITLASYFSQANMPEQNSNSRRRRSVLGDDQADVEVGIDEETLRIYPKVTYSEAKTQGNSTTASCCSICLADYKDTDMLRLLPECRQLFHLKCVDPWLRLHPTCPICRTSPAPSSLPTPLAEVVPVRQTSY